MKVSYLCANTYADTQVVGRAKYPFPPELYDRDVGQRSFGAALANAKLAEDVGFDWISVSEHHFAPGIMAPNAIVLAGALTQVVRRARIALLGPIVSINNPVRLAEEIALLDLMSGGRALVFLLRGTAEEFNTYYVNPYESRERAQEAITLIQHALTEPQPFGWAGRYFEFPTVAVWPRPAQTPHPPIFSSGNSPESCVFAARNRHGLAISFIPPEIAAKSVELYKSTCEKEGWTPAAEQIVYRCFIAIGETAEDAEEQGRTLGFDTLQANARAPKGLGPLSWMEHLDDSGKDPPENRGNANDADQDGAARGGQGYGLGSLQLRGTPDAIVEQIERFHSTTGAGVLDLMFSNLGGPEAVAKRIRLFGNDVLPHIRHIGRVPEAIAQGTGFAGG